MKVMIVGGMNEQIVAASKIASSKGARVFLVSDIKSALHSLRNGRSADILLVEISHNIKELVRSLNEERIVIPIIACGVKMDKEKAIQAIRAGAKEYISLPPDEEVISAVFESIYESNEQTSIIYESQEFRAVIGLADQIAQSEASVLITGESGTGKEVIAKYIHKKSKRNGNDMVSINCAAIPDNLLESELFGYEKGAFTGAIDRRIGKFEEANRSTILLDEISEMDLRLQAKLLRAIQEKEIYRVGGAKPVKLDIRILATSNKNLNEEVKLGKFREDLFFRLNVININIPSLRERKSDIKVLSEFFIKKYAKVNDIPTKELSDQALNKLCEYNWPGNVRELENTIHRTLLLSSMKEISKEDIVLTTKGDKHANDDFDGQTLESMEKKIIENTWNKYQGNYDKTASVLGITIRILKKKLDQYKLAS